MAGLKPALVFIGFMGAGKTASAVAVASELGEACVDADEAFASARGELPSELIEREGEAAFRTAEEELVLGLLDGEARVIALGGGAVEIPRVREALEGHVVVWCQVELEEARRRIEEDPEAWRPLAADAEGLAERFERRAPIYETLATAVLPAGDPGLPTRAAGWLDALRELPGGTRMVWADSASGGYPIFVGSGLIGAEWPPTEGRPFGISDSTVAEIYLQDHGFEQLLLVEPGEKSKSLAEAERLLGLLADAGMTRRDHIVAFGGGVVGDLAGFCAATYQRGVALSQIPTTLVGQVDSAIGGKTGVDIPQAKNYVGAYHQPTAVISDVNALSTLPEPELAAGWVEVIKTGLLAGGKLWELVRRIEKPDRAGLDEIVFACARFKAEVVAADERDSGRRAILNLGHTIGHAIEASTGYGRYRHGEAVGLGLLAALRLSGADDLREEVQALLEGAGLPTHLETDVEVPPILEAVERDKKRDAEGVRFVLLERPGEPREGQLVEPDRVRAAVEEIQR